MPAWKTGCKGCLRLPRPHALIATFCLKRLLSMWPTTCLLTDFWPVSAALGMGTEKLLWTEWLQRQKALRLTCSSSKSAQGLQPQAQTAERCIAEAAWKCRKGPAAQLLPRNELTMRNPAASCGMTRQPGRSFRWSELLAALMLLSFY